MPTRDSIVVVVPMLAALASIALPPRDSGVSLRCGPSVIHPGTTTGAVLDQCGPPTVEGPLRREVVLIRDGDVWREVVVDRMTWTYDRGPREFVRLLYFENDTLKVIELGGYGSR
jgi:Protein of unknown function (DUF2845)